VPPSVKEVSDGLQYRDFITVGLLAKKLSVTEPGGGLLKDTWIYIQEPDVLLGRLQIFNNWSPYMVADPATVWLGLEYFCHETDDLWKMPDEDLKAFGARELEKIGILKAEDVLDGHVVRVPKTYPAYFGTYSRFDELRSFTDGFENLFLVGRNGMHKYKQPGSLHAHGDGCRRQDPCRRLGQILLVGDQHRAGVPRGKGRGET